MPKNSGLGGLLCYWKRERGRTALERSFHGPAGQGPVTSGIVPKQKLWFFAHEDFLFFFSSFFFFFVKDLTEMVCFSDSGIVLTYFFTNRALVFLL